MLDLPIRKLESYVHIVLHIHCLTLPIDVACIRKMERVVVPSISVHGCKCNGCFTLQEQSHDTHYGEHNASSVGMKCRVKNALSEVGFEPTPGEPDCDLNAAP